MPSRSGKTLERLTPYERRVYNEDVNIFVDNSPP